MARRSIIYFFRQRDCVKVVKSQPFFCVLTKRQTTVFQNVVTSIQNNNYMNFCQNRKSFNVMESNTVYHSVTKEEQRPINDSSCLSYSPPLKICKLSCALLDSPKTNVCTSSDTHYPSIITPAIFSSSIVPDEILNEKNPLMISSTCGGECKNMTEAIVAKDIPTPTCTSHYEAHSQQWFPDLPFANEINIVEEVERCPKSLNRRERRKLKKIKKSTEKEHETCCLPGWSELPFASEEVFTSELCGVKTTKPTEQNRRTKTSKFIKSMKSNNEDSKIGVPNYFVAVQINDQTVT